MKAIDRLEEDEIMTFFISFRYYIRVFLYFSVFAVFIFVCALYWYFVRTVIQWQ